MISFENFDHMLRFAKEVDVGLQSLEEKLKNPSKLRYCDREENARKAAQCLDSLDEELSDIQEEIGSMIVKETKDIEMLIEERDRVAEYLKDIDKEIKHYEKKLIPYGFKCNTYAEKVQHNSCNVVNEESLECSLENTSVFKTSKILKMNATFLNHQTNLDQSNKSFPEQYTTPKVSEISVPSFSTSKRLSERKNKVYGNNDKLCSTEKYRKPLQLINNKVTPNFNRELFNDIQIYTPPDPGFSDISRQAYALSLSCLKQKKLAK